MAKDEESKASEASEEKSAQKAKSKNPILIILAVLVAVAGIYLVATRLSGFAGQKVSQKAVEQALEQATGEDVDVDFSGEEEFTLRTEEGTFTAGKQELPEDFPSDIPLYQGAEVISIASNPEKISVQFESQDSQPEIHDFYNKNLVVEGWEITEEVALENSSVLAFQKDERNGVVAITQGEEATSITISTDLGTE